MMTLKALICVLVAVGVQASDDIKIPSRKEPTEAQLKEVGVSRGLKSTKGEQLIETLKPRLAVAVEEQLDTLRHICHDLYKDDDSVAEGDEIIADLIDKASRFSESNKIYSQLFSKYSRGVQPVTYLGGAVDILNDEITPREDERPVTIPGAAFSEATMLYSMMVDLTKQLLGHTLSASHVDDHVVDQQVAALGVYCDAEGLTAEEATGDGIKKLTEALKEFIRKLQQGHIKPVKGRIFPTDPVHAGLSDTIKRLTGRAEDDDDDVDYRTMVHASDDEGDNFSDEPESKDEVDAGMARRANVVMRLPTIAKNVKDLHEANEKLTGDRPTSWDEEHDDCSHEGLYERLISRLCKKRHGGTPLPKGSSTQNPLCGHGDTGNRHLETQVESKASPTKGPLGYEAIKWTTQPSLGFQTPFLSRVANPPMSFRTSFLSRVASPPMGYEAIQWTTQPSLGDDGSRSA